MRFRYLEYSATSERGGPLRLPVPVDTEADPTLDLEVAPAFQV